MSNQEINFYFELSNNKTRVYNYSTNKYTTMTQIDMYKLKKRFSLLVGYEATDDGLKEFAVEFFVWIATLKKNKIFEFDYLKYSSHEQVCIGIFKKLCSGKYEDMEDIDEIEYEFIEACNNAGLRYCEAGKYQCYGYDYSSKYPSILASDGFEIPTCKGQVKTISELPDKLEVGYYKVKITSNDKRFKKVFAYSKKHVYTHISLFFAQNCKSKQGYDINIELIQEENNCYIYGKNKKDNIIKGSVIFGKWYKYLFELKEAYPKNKLIKYMTSALWGRLSQHNRLFKTFDMILDENIDAVPEYDINHEYYIRDVTQNKKGDDVYELVNCKKPYHFNIARIKPFLLAKSRDLTGKVAVKYIDHCVRIHTDNVTFNQEHDNVIFHQKTFKLTKEHKTSGLIQFRRVDCYKNYDNDKYTTKNFKDDYLEDETDENYD
jgi:hypothetical protein